MTPDEYYTAPTQKVFDEIKAAALTIWCTYKDPYRKEKMERVEPIQNYADNAWYIVAMFDNNNQRKLLTMVSDETVELIKKAQSY